MQVKRTVADLILVTRLLASGLLLIMCGCGALYEVDIAASNPKLNSIGRYYVLVPADSAVTSNSVEFQRYSGYVEQALSQKGLKRLSETEIANADIEIHLAYSVGSPKAVSYKSRTQMFEQRVGGGGEPSTRESAGGEGDTSGGSTSRMPEPQTQQDLVGVNNHSFTKTYYDREISLTAIPHDADSNGGAAENVDPIWWLSGFSSGSSPDPDEFVPVLAAAIAPYVGDNSVLIIKTKIGALDARVKAIRDGVNRD